MLLSTYSQTENGEDPLVFFVEPLNHVITIRGQILVSRTNDDPLLPRVYRHHAHMLKHMCAWCRHTQGRFECTQGGRFVHTHTFFSTFFQRAATHTNTHTHTHTPNTPHNTTAHNTTRRQRQRETEKEGQRKRRQDKKREDETRKEKTRQEKRRRDKKSEETRR